MNKWCKLRVMATNESVTQVQTPTTYFKLQVPRRTTAHASVVNVQCIMIITLAGNLNILSRDTLIELSTNIFRCPSLTRCSESPLLSTNGSTRQISCHCLSTTMPTHAQSGDDEESLNMDDQSRDLRKNRLSVSLALGRRKKKK